MKMFVTAAALSIAALFPAISNAAVIEFDTNGLLMSDASPNGGGGLYSPSGTFVFDTDTGSVFAVSVSTQFGSYQSGVYNSGDEVFSLLSANPSDVVLDISIFFSDLLAEIAGQIAGYTFSMGAYPEEYNAAGDLGFGIDPTLFGTILDPTSGGGGGGGGITPVPLPAGMPLLLGAFGVMTVMRRRKKT